MLPPLKINVVLDILDLKIKENKSIITHDSQQLYEQFVRLYE